MFLQEINNGSSSVFRHYINPLFELEAEQGKDTYIHYLRVGGNTIGQYKAVNDYAGQGASENTQYLHRDHLGSITAITDETALVVESLSYDAHGKRRQPSWDDAASQVFASSNTNRSFTGHRYLDEVGIIHMGGRVYDPDIGRFMSADPFIQEVANQQNFNRYTYVLNNPLSATDPSGFFFGFFKKLFKRVFKALGRIFKAAVNIVKAVVKNIRVIAAIGVTFIPGVNAAAAGFLSGFIASGGDFKAGLIGALTGQAFSSIGSHFAELKKLGGGVLSAGQKFAKVIAHGVVGGASQLARGGKFLAGFVSAGFSQGLEQLGFYDAVGVGLPAEGDVGGYIKNGVAAAIVGGTASVLGGGKFANGAITGAFSRLFNDVSHGTKRRLSRGELRRASPEKQAREINRLLNSFTGGTAVAAGVAICVGSGGLGCLLFGGPLAVGIGGNDLYSAYSGNESGYEFVFDSLFDAPEIGQGLDFATDFAGIKGVLHGPLSLIGQTNIFERGASILQTFEGAASLKFTFEGAEELQQQQ